MIGVEVVTVTDRKSEGYDVIVVGAGAAGLNGALMLARARRTVLVIDGGQPRNASAEGVHGLLGLEGIAPAALLERGREEVRRYGGEVRAGTVATINRTDEGFTVTLDDGSVAAARRLLIATGLVDELPDVPGLRERFGTDVVHCPYCHGFEVRDRAIGVLGTGPMSVHQALLFRQWSADVVYLPHLQDTPSGGQAEQLAARGIRVVPGEVVGVEPSADDSAAIAGVRLADGSLVARDVLAVATRMVARAGFLAGLGLRAQDHPSGMGQYVPTDASGRTDVDGVWAAGNITDLSAQVGAAASAGALAGAQINFDLVTEETSVAVDAYRAAMGVPTSFAPSVVGS